MSIFDRIVTCSLCSTSTDFHVQGRKFKKIRKLGEGGFSLVYIVQEIGSGRQKFALKEMVCHSEREVQRAEHEINIHKLCADQPNILHLECYQVGTSRAASEQTLVYSTKDRSLHDATQVILVMPLFSCGTLQDELDRRRLSQERIDECRVLRLFADVCAALVKLHSLQPPIAHRDVKCANILVSEAGGAVLMDFGSACEARVDVSDKTAAQQLQDDAAEFSSMAYRPPELFAVDTHSAVDERTDIWSLGCVLYALCFLLSPFDAVHQRGDSVALAVQSPSAVNIPQDSPYSDGVHQLIGRLLAVDMYMRPSAATVLSIVQGMLEHLPSANTLTQRTTHSTLNT